MIALSRRLPWYRRFSAPSRAILAFTVFVTSVYAPNRQSPRDVAENSLLWVVVDTSQSAVESSMSDDVREAVLSVVDVSSLGVVVNSILGVEQ